MFWMGWWAHWVEAVVSIVNTGHPSVEVQIEVGVMRRTDYFGFAVDCLVLRKVAHCPKLAVARTKEGVGL